MQAAVLVMSMAAAASAKPSRKVKVDSTPAGATVYIESVENGAACNATPCTINAPLGDVTLIVQLAGYQPEFQQVTVTRGSRAIPVSVTLTAAIGTLRIVGAPKGATIKINDEDKGKVGSGPFEIEMPAGSVGVKVVLAGKTIATELADIPANDTAEITVNATSVADASDAGGDDSGDDGSDAGDGDGSDDGPRDDGEGSGSDVKPPAPRLAVVEAGLALDIAFRSFELSDGTAPFSNTGEVLVGPAIEFWPGRLAGVRVLRGVSVFARVEFGATHQKVTRDTSGMSVGAETLWGGIEASVRQTWHFGAIGVQASGGFVRDQAQFNADTTSALAMVPSADYRSLRVGARVSYALGRIEPYVGAEDRIVFSGGDLANRGDNAKATGYRAGLGARAAFGRIAARAEFSYGKFSWTYSGSGPSGASDTIKYLTFVVGYAY